MRLPSRLSALIAAGAAAALLAGCGGSGEQPQAAPSPQGPEAVSLVRAAAGVTKVPGSARYFLSTATTINDQDVVLTGEGVYDWQARKGRTTYVIPVGKVEQRLLGDSLFFVLPQQTGVFFRVSAGEVATTPLGGTVDPTAQVLALAAVTEAERVGEQEVRGEVTTHYRGSYDVARAIELAQGSQREALRSSLGAASGVSEAPFDVFLDDDGRLRRLTQTVEVPASPATNGQELTVTTTLELYEYGLDVIVPGPPADKIRDGAPLLAALRAALPTPTPAPTPAAPSAPAAPPGSPGAPAPVPAAPAPAAPAPAG